MVNRQFAPVAHLFQCLASVTRLQRLAPVISFPALSTRYMFSRSLHLLRFPALATRYPFSRARRP